MEDTLITDMFDYLSNISAELHFIADDTPEMFTDIELQVIAELNEVLDNAFDHYHTLGDSIDD